MITSNTIIQKVILTFSTFSALANIDTHATTNTFLDTQRSEFALFAIEKEDALKNGGTYPLAHFLGNFREKTKKVPTRTLSRKLPKKFPKS